MKKIVLFVLALTAMGSLQAQEVISLPQPEVSKLSMSLGDALQQRRSQREYSDRAPNDKFGAMDTGYVSQNIYLACTALGLKTVARATMDFDALKRELNLAETSYLELNHPIGY